ncbi:MAG: 4-hydroxyacetophenone monooxygenase [Pseudomonadales bacterium RIFCSPLOWO2_12_59_9]|nr:MAG: 4-hydroxyacetophenone monooxygenase [Pseudomonadales bacterium RIFCSPLOWO2_12_59_9]
MNNSAQAASNPKTVDVLIIGSGFGGLGMAIKLREAGNDNFVILEKAEEVGGTWRENSYPGAACDVQSHMYSFSFAPKSDWSKRYAGWQEIQQYILDTTAKFGIRPFVRFKREVCGMHFDPAKALWTVDTSAGEQFVARHVVLASGPLHVPSIPKLPGQENFKGKLFHSAHWDHDYDLTGKQVVSIGTGGSAIQYAPEIAAKVAKLNILQRTPAWVIPRDERSYADWEKGLFARLPFTRFLHRARLYWSNESRVWPLFAPRLAGVLQKLAELFITTKVKNPALAKALTPNYLIGCKRILISNKWLPMFNRDNVELISEGIKELREHSVVLRDGRELPADCIILGTGFVTDPRIYMKDFPCTGLPGHDLMQDWQESAEAYYGTTVTGFPNLYQLVGPNTGLGHNSIIFMIEAQVHYVLQCLKRLQEKGADYLDVKPQVQREFNQKLQARFVGTAWSSGCSSWYQQAGGKNVLIWPGATWRFWLQTRRVRDEDYEFVTCASQPQPAELLDAQPSVA